MNPYITGAIIRAMREKNQLTQAQLAQRLNVSDKAVSKWETAKGYPDITLLEPIAQVFGVSVAELISGTAVTNQNRAGNMLRSGFYVCPVCGNVLFAVGEASIHCHGVPLTPCEAEPADDGHRARIEVIEDEYYIHIPHPMTKEHYISFIAALSPDGIQLVKLYPEGSAEARFSMRSVRHIAYYCNRDGLFTATPPADNFQRKKNDPGHNSVRLNDSRQINGKGSLKMANSNSNNNQINVPEARQAMYDMKHEVANELGITLNDGYNGNLSSKDAGHIGGNMVKNVLPIRTTEHCLKVDKRFIGKRLTSVQYRMRLGLSFVF